MEKRVYGDAKEDTNRYRVISYALQVLRRHDKGLSTRDLIARLTERFFTEMAPGQQRNRISSLLAQEKLSVNPRLTQDEAKDWMPTSAIALQTEFRMTMKGLQPYVVQNREKRSGNAPKMLHVIDSQPEFAWIDKREIRIDDTYQRRISPTKVRLIAAEWSWKAAGVLKVSLRGDGNWYAFDGGHRREAALLRSDITILPCLVYEVENVAEEAQGFLLTNTFVNPMKRTDRFRAAVISGEHAAMVISELALASHYTVTSTAGPRSVSCVGALEECVRADEPALRRLWPLLVALSEAKGAQITSELVRGLFYLATNAPLFDRKWRDRVLAVGTGTLLKEAKRFAMLRGRATPRALAEGMLSAINARLRQKLACEGIIQ